MTLELIHAELVRIREALEARPYSAGAPTHKAVATQAKTDEVPLPSELIANAGDVQVHFGKNKGVALSTLGDRSVAWYAQEPEPRLRNDGTPFPPRAEDVLLRNAARTIIHQKRGTISASVSDVAPKEATTTTTVMNESEESSIPF